MQLLQKYRRHLKAKRVDIYKLINQIKMYNEQIENLIKLALADGELTEKEKLREQKNNTMLLQL